MKKYIIVLSFFYGIIGYGSCSYEIQPPLTAEMQSLGLTPFPSRVQQIVDVYLVDDETWIKRLEEAKQKFEALKHQEQEGADIGLLLSQYWSIARDYDYAPANDELIHIFIGGEDCNVRFKSDKWSDFFDTGRPTRLCDMDYNREAYLSDKNFYLRQREAEKNGVFASEDHELEEHSFHELLKQKKISKTATWHFSDLFSWLSRISTASSRTSDEGTSSNESFSSRETTPPKDEESESESFLSGLSSSVTQPMRTGGLRHRNVRLKK